MLNYTELLMATYADRQVSLDGEDRDFTFTIHNPEWDGGDIVVSCEDGELCLDFVSMHLSFGDSFGELVEQMDALIFDECMVFELYSHGECVLGGCRGTDEIDIDHSLSAFVRSLRDGSAALYAEIKAIVQKGNCYCRLRGWSKERNRSLILS